MPSHRISIGVEPSQPIADADSFVNGDMVHQGADFAVLPIMRATAVAEQTLDRGYFELDDLAIKTSASSYCLLGATSPWTNDAQREALVNKQIEYAGYTGLKGVVTPAIEGDESAVAAYGRLLYSLLADETGPSVYVRVCAGADNAWKRWNYVRVMCNHSERLQVLLELDPEAAGSVPMQQWHAEPVRVVVLPASMFVENSSGYPVLPRRHQTTVKEWMDYSVAFAVQEPETSSGVGDQIRYMRHLADTLPGRDLANTASDEYRDVLQAPLQPLMDHLESVTYETFEQDEPKYAHYEEAMVRAIGDVAARPEHTGPIVLMVVGAGRGPLVSRALQASRRLDADVHVYALEKNPSALVELQRKNAELWLGAVTLVHADMRWWQPSERADILVSELLGSFGDNELSPECLDGALDHLAAANCVCIPRRYTAYAAPVSSAVLFRRAREYGSSHGLETPYVVNMHAAHVLADAQPLWSFCHDGSAAAQRVTWASNAHNQRASSAMFSASCASMVHGLAAFFDAELYPGVVLSICPDTHTAEMHSWFPMYFPIKRPLTVAAGSGISVHMWRRTGGTKTWYEWSVDAGGDSSGIHNINGHEYWIGQ
ncbi:hypothetical protein LPJ63_001484 [Coemansia sp. RSA 2711]|nr:hypothetical protein LPJ63_001484 [Coemansia sp. RSA 2711]